MAGPYRWDRYDVLVMPRAFAYGGMENPRLSFVSPSIIAGDRSLVSTVVHELAHSWSGNLVTNATWDDFWLNEGFTSYLERRMVETLYGERRADMEDAIAYEELVQTIEDLEADGHPSGHRPAARPRRPRPERGHVRRRLPQGPLVPRLPRGTLRTARFRCVPARVFRCACVPEHDDGRLPLRGCSIPERPGAPAITAAEIDAWIYRPGLPATMPKVAEGVFEAVDRAAADWRAGRIATDELPVKDWMPQEWVRFLDEQPADLDGREARGVALDVQAGRRRQRRNRAELAASS